MKCQLFAMILSACLAASALPCSAGDPPHASQNGLHLRVYLRDGNTWVLDDKGLGRPFTIGLLLDNGTDKVIDIWDNYNSEGAQSPQAVLVDEKGNERVFKAPAIPRLAGMPTVLHIPPHGKIRIEMELLRFVDAHSLPPGKYALHARYENQMPGGGERFAAVWSGLLETEPVHIEIVRPSR